MVSKVKIMDIEIDKLTMSQTISEVERFIIDNKPLHLMGVNADKLNLCQSNDRLKEIVQQCDIINADGASVVLASKYLGEPLPERVAGIDLMQHLLKLCEEKGYSTYFLGAKEQVLQDMIEKFQHNYPNLLIAGRRNGYFSDEEFLTIIEDIRQSKAQVVFIGITSPKKEYLVQQLLDAGVNAVFMGVGGSFDVLSGHISRAPLWMQNCHLEWLFRVMNEPKRLFKRYFVGNITFIKAIVLEKRSK